MKKSISKYKILGLVFFLALSLEGWGQICANDSIPIGQGKRFIESIEFKGKNSRVSLISDENTWIAIKPWIVQKNGVNAISNADLQVFISNLNSTYLASKLQFFLLESSIINANSFSDDIWQMLRTDASENKIGQNTIYRNNNAINLYFIEGFYEFQFLNGSAIGTKVKLPTAGLAPYSISEIVANNFNLIKPDGKSIFNDPKMNAVYIQGSSLSSGKSILAHEIGHYFGLFHTFTGSTYKSERDNAISGGDFISDTPIDLNGAVLLNSTNNYWYAVNEITENCTNTKISVAKNNTNPAGSSYGSYSLVSNKADFKVIDQGTLTANELLTDPKFNSPPISNLMSYYSSNGVLCSSENTEITEGQTNRINNFVEHRKSLIDTYNIFSGVPNPANLTGIRVRNSIYLSWQIASTSTELGLILEKSISSNGNYIKIADIPFNQISFVDSNTDPNLTYFYRVRVSGSTASTNVSVAPQNYTPGITVLTHGFQLPGSMSGDWKEYANAVRNRLSTELGLNKGATIFVSKPNGRWAYLDNGDKGNGIFNPNNEEVIFLYDWGASSNKSLISDETGYLEASADVLFAMLTNPIVEFDNGGTVNIGGTTPASLITSKNTHFIGHSRGTILLLQTLYRLKTHFPTFDLERLSLLDPHPAGFFGDVKRGNIAGSFENLPGVGGLATNCVSILCADGNQSVYLTVPDNVVKVENYYRQDPNAYEPIGSYNTGINPFSGIPLVEGNNSYLFNNEVMSSASGIIGGAHGAVPEWYFKTMDFGWELSSSENEYWFKGLEGNFMINKNRYNSGYNQTLPSIPIRATLPQYNLTYQNRTSKAQLEKVFAGDFNYNNWAGWYLNNWGNFNPIVVNGELNLFPVEALASNKIRYATHNIMYFPANYTSISLDVKLDLGTYTGATMPMLILEYYNANGQKFRQAVKSLSLTPTAQFTRIHFGLPSELQGKNGTFRLLFGDNGALNAYNSANLKIIIDNIELSNETLTITPPVISASQTTIQGGQSVVLSATGCTNGTVHWTTGETGTTITVTPYETTGYAAYCSQDGFYSTPSNAIAIVVNYSHTISNAEYFFDSDPGFGNANALAVNTTGNINQTFNIGLAPHGLNQGVHTFNIRVKDNKNDWSLTHTRPFLILGQGTGISENITHIEYFYDSLKVDKSNLIVQTVTPDGFNNIALPLTINLTQGVHTVSFRAKDNTGKYSLFHTRPFLVLGFGSGIPSSISQIEYFFDTDPGFGNGTQVAYSADGSGKAILNLNLASMSAGVHTIYVRVKDNTGRWSLTHVRPFVIMPTGLNPSATITKVEYFLDNIDPGRGLATNVTFTSGTDVTVNFNIDLLPLTVGTHTLAIRVQDSNGNWSSISTVQFDRPTNICEQNRIISVAITNGSQTVQASQTINANNKISGSGTVVNYGAKAVTLNPGFEAGGGVVFKVDQQGCGN